MHESVKSFDLSIDKNTRDLKNTIKYEKNKQNTREFSKINTNNMYAGFIKQEDINIENPTSFSQVFEKLSTPKEFNNSASGVIKSNVFLQNYDTNEKSELLQKTAIDMPSKILNNTKKLSSDSNIFKNTNNYDTTNSKYQKTSKNNDFTGVQYKNINFINNENTFYKNSENINDYKMDHSDKIKNISSSGNLYNKKSVEFYNKEQMTPKIIDNFSNNFENTKNIPKSEFQTTENTNFEEFYRLIENKLRQEMRD